jgi:hypothetical protein
MRHVAVTAVFLLAFSLPVSVVVTDAARGWPEGPSRALYTPLVVLFAIVGSVLSTRRPGNVIGPLLLAFGLVFALYLPIDLLAHEPDPGAAVRVAAVLSSASDAPMFILMAWILLLFPTGRLLSPRWRWTIWLGSAAIPIGVLGFVFQPGPVVAFPWLDNPLGVPGFPSQLLGGFAYATLLALLVAAAVAMTRRFRAGGAVERAQVKWVVAAALVLLPTEIGNLMTFRADDPYAQPFWLVASSVALALVPIAICVAILRYRLYDIDRLISRTVSYLLVSGVIGVAFVAMIVVLQAALAPFTQRQTLAVAGSTLVAVALFQPVRRWLQAAVDRRFDRRRADARLEVDSFASRLRNEVDLATVVAELDRAVRRTVAPSRRGVWVRGMDQRR